MDELPLPPGSPSVAGVPSRGRRAPQGPPGLEPGRDLHARPGQRPLGRARSELGPPAAVAAAGAIAYLALGLPSADLAAQGFRADLFDRAGLTLFSTAWYGGHHTLGYSVLLPLLGGLLGERVVGALALVAATVLCALLAGRRAALWFVPGVLAALVSGRITFVLGVAVGTGAVLAAHRGRTAMAGVLGALTAAASPVAAVFAVVAGAALALARARRGATLGSSRFAGVALAAGAAATTLAVAVAFPTGGTFPFALSSFVPAFAAGLAVAVAAPPGPVRIGGALYALLCLLALLVPSPLGGNAARLGTLLAVPVTVALLWPHRRGALTLLALPLAYWVLQPAVRDVSRAAGDPSVEAAFHAPLVAELHARAREPVRVEVPLTQNHGEARHLAAHVAIARGWERQLDRGRNALFYRGALTPERYRRWLDDNAVSFVALPLGLSLDAAGEREAQLIASGRAPYLREVARPRGWRLFAVDRPRPLAGGPATVTRLGPDGFTLRADAQGTTTVRVRFTPYWAVTEGRGCVSRAPGGWTSVRATGVGTLAVRPRFAVERLGATGPRCAP